MATFEPSDDPLPEIGKPELVDASFLRGGLSPQLAGADPAHAAQLAALPLTSSDRSAAASRILTTHPHWSDRWIASVCGVAPRTVAALRERSTDDRARLNTRLGRDGRRRPVSALDGRRRAAEVMLRRPEATLREVAREAEISVGTALAVRRQLAAREAAPGGGPAAGLLAPPQPPAARPSTPAVVIRSGLERLTHDPSLRYTERGRALLRLLSATLAFVNQSEAVADQIPGHCREVIGDIARACSAAWHEFGDRLGEGEGADRAA